MEGRRLGAEYCPRKTGTQNPIVKAFDESIHLTDQKHAKYFTWTHARVTQIILSMIFLMYSATIQCLTNKGQESKTCNLQFIFWTPVTLKQSHGHQTYHSNVDPKQVIIMQSLKDLTLMVSEKKPTSRLSVWLFVFQIRKSQLSLLTMCVKSKR